MNILLTVGFFAPLGHAHDELKSEFIVATTVGTSHRWSPADTMERAGFDGCDDTMDFCCSKWHTERDLEIPIPSFVGELLSAAYSVE